MDRDDALLWTHQPTRTRAPKPAELAWTIERKGVVWQAFYRGHGEWGWECQIFKAGDFFCSRRHQLRAGAELEADTWRREIESGLLWDTRAE